MTRARKTARAVSLRTDQRPVLYVASLVLMVALLLAGCAKVPYPPPELRASNDGNAAWPTAAQTTAAPAATAPTPTASIPAAPIAGIQGRSPDLAAALTAARAAQTPVVAPAAPQIAQVRADAERVQREAAERRAKQAAATREQKAAARKELQQRTARTAKATQPAPTSLPRSDTSDQANRAAELARAKAAFEQRQSELAAAPKAIDAPAPGDTGVAGLAESPAMPAPPPAPATAPTETVASTPLAEPDLALQIASRGGPDGGAGESAGDPMAEPNLMTSLARLSPAAGDTGPTSSIGGADLSVVFNEGSGELSVDARNQLFELAQRLQEAPGIDVRLFGYADGLGEGPSRARRLSLSRLMTVRKFLIRQGVDMNALDGRAMGEDPVAQNSTDRVDIVIVRR